MILTPVLQSYSVNNVIVTSGAFIISTFDEISVRYDEVAWKFTQGCYGKVVRSKITNKLGTITITLPQTAAGNAYNSLQFKTLSDIKGINGVIPVSISDLWGGSLHVMSKGTIIQYPMSVYSKDATQRQWKIRGELDVNILAARSTTEQLINTIQ